MACASATQISCGRTAFNARRSVAGCPLSRARAPRPPAPVRGHRHPFDRIRVRDRAGAEPAERVLEHALHGAAIGLPLPPAEARAVIVQHELQRASRHRTESYPTRGGVSSKSAWHARARRGAHRRYASRVVIDFVVAERPIFRAASDRDGAPPSRRMPPRTLATLAHALSVAPDVDAALLALADALAEVDRFAQIALVRYDARREMLVDRLSRRMATSSRARGSRRRSTTCRRASGSPSRRASTFVDFGDHSDEFAPLFALKKLQRRRAGWRCAACASRGSCRGDHRALRDAQVLRHAYVGATRARRRAVRARLRALPRARSARRGGAHARGRDAARARRVRAEARRTLEQQLAQGVGRRR